MTGLADELCWMDFRACLCLCLWLLFISMVIRDRTEVANLLRGPAMLTEECTEKTSVWTEEHHDLCKEQMLEEPKIILT